MRIVADLHIHSPFSLTASARLTPPWLERWARIKGIDLLGTGDCTHPRWLAELRELLGEAVARMRSGELFISPGCDRKYGIIRVFPPDRNRARRD